MRLEPGVERLAGSAKKPKVRFVSRTEKGGNFGIIGVGRVTPPKKAGPDDEPAERETRTRRRCGDS
jgi:hypothetical protein